MKANRGRLKGTVKDEVDHPTDVLRVTQPKNVLQDMHDNLGNLAAINDAICSMKLLNEGFEGKNISSLHQHILDYIESYKADSGIPIGDDLGEGLRKKLVSAARKSFDYYHLLQTDFDPEKHLTAANFKRIHAALSDSFNPDHLKKYGFLEKVFSDHDNGVINKEVVVNIVVLGNVIQKLESDYMEKNLESMNQQRAAVLLENELDEKGYIAVAEQYKPITIQNKLLYRLDDLMKDLQKFHQAMPEKYADQLEIRDLVEKLFAKLDQSDMKDSLKSVVEEIGILLFEDININGLDLREKKRLIDAMGKYVEKPNAQNARTCRDWILAATIKYGVDVHEINQICEKLPQLLVLHALEKKPDLRPDPFFVQEKTNEPGEIFETEKSPKLSSSE